MGEFFQVGTTCKCHPEKGIQFRIYAGTTTAPSGHQWTSFHLDKGENGLATLWKHTASVINKTKHFTQAGSWQVKDIFKQRCQPLKFKIHFFVHSMTQLTGDGQLWQWEESAKLPNTPHQMQAGHKKCSGNHETRWKCFFPPFAAQLQYIKWYFGITSGNK